MHVSCLQTHVPSWWCGVTRQLWRAERVLCLVPDPSECCQNKRYQVRRPDAVVFCARPQPHGYRPLPRGCAAVDETDEDHTQLPGICSEYSPFASDFHLAHVIVFFMNNLLHIENV